MNIISLRKTVPDGENAIFEICDPPPLDRSLYPISKTAASSFFISVPAANTATELSLNQYDISSDMSLTSITPSF